MAQLGKLPPRYQLLLNPYTNQRVSKCTLCRKPTHPRKFPLFVVIHRQHPIVLGKTCKYCSKCELIVVHEHELVAELVFHSKSLGIGEVSKDDYFLVGTADKKFWKQGLAGKASSWQEILQHVADFTQHYTLEVEPGGWFPSDK